MATVPVPVSTASLYVGDLDPSVTEAQLFELFSQVGPVASIRVCRDAVTRKSLGYAYVNYNTTLDEASALRALDELNYTVVNGMAMRIMWSQRDPTSRRSGLGNVFIKSLDESIDHKALHDTFSAFGNILSCKIAMTKDGKSKGYGFVHFETEEAALLAIEKVNGMLLEGKKVYVGKFVKRTERDGYHDQPVFTNVYVKNLDTNTTEDELREKFAAFGAITKLVIMTDENGNSKGFGFVNYEEPEHAKQAVETLNDTQLGSKVIYVARAQKKGERLAQLKQLYEERRQERYQKYQGVNLYVKNLDDSITEEKLKEEFSTYGTITSVKIMQDEKGNSKGFGFICFASQEESSRALSEANGRMFSGKPIYIALAQRKEDRRQQLEQLYAGYPMHNPMMPPGTPLMRPGPGGMYPPNGAPMYFAGPPGMMAAPTAMTQGQRQIGAPGIVYPQQGGPQQQGGMPRPWRPTPMQGAQQGQQLRPGAYQPAQPYGGPMAVNRGNNQRQNRQQQQRPGVQATPMAPGSQTQAPPAPGSQPIPGQMQPVQVSIKDVPRNQQRNGRPFKHHPNANARAYAPQGMPLPNGMPVPNGVLPNGVAPLANGGPVPLPVPASGEVLNPSILATLSPEQQKQLLGERLFPFILGRQPELAGKITGMLLEMDNSELLLLLESPEALNLKVDEALIVLQQHSGGPAEGQASHQEVTHATDASETNTLAPAPPAAAGAPLVEAV